MVNYTSIDVAKINSIFNKNLKKELLTLNMIHKQLIAAYTEIANLNHEQLNVVGVQLAKNINKITSYQTQIDNKKIDVALLVDVLSTDSHVLKYMNKNNQKILDSAYMIIVMFEVAIKSRNQAKK